LQAQAVEGLIIKIKLEIAETVPSAIGDLKTAQCLKEGSNSINKFIALMLQVRQLAAV
jgi:hypothetical protein